MCSGVILSREVIIPEKRERGHGQRKRGKGRKDRGFDYGQIESLAEISGREETPGAHFVGRLPPCGSGSPAIP
ncbi:MAG: hypothetical protein M1553_02180 [Firmicutes bacterium]|nr:hypothetical protein [Bacillota bacterium]